MNRNFLLLAYFITYSCCGAEREPIITVRTKTNLAALALAGMHMALEEPNALDIMVLNTACTDLCYEQILKPLKSWLCTRQSAYITGYAFNLCALYLASATGESLAIKQGLIDPRDHYPQIAVLTCAITNATQHWVHYIEMPIPETLPRTIIVGASTHYGATSKGA